MFVEPYLFFPGTCEEALGFYQSVFGGEVSGIMRYGDMPPGAHPPGPPELAQKVMHSVFKSPGVNLMAADNMRLAPGTEAERVALSIALTDVAEGERIFNALAAGGTVGQPYTKQFWRATFGMLTDKFGIDWMVNAGGG